MGAWADSGDWLGAGWAAKVAAGAMLGWTRWKVWRGGLTCIAAAE